MPETPNLEDAVEFAGNPKPPSRPSSLRLRRNWMRAATIMVGLMLLAVLLPACNNPSPEKKAETSRPAPVSPSPSPAASIPSGMVAVPAGEFFMGCNKWADGQCSDEEKPGRTISLDAFAIDTYEVTVANYRQCVEAGKCTAPDTPIFCNWNQSDRAQHPINCIDWEQAQTYCRWAGKRLPTEAEWEKAARGTDKRVYPWGNEWDAGKANAGGRNDGTVAVGSYATGISPYGAHDMSGNVWEWTADWYLDVYYQNSPVRNPKGPESGKYRSARGGSWGVHPQDARASSRDWGDPGRRSDTRSFRCAQGLGAGD